MLELSTIKLSTINDKKTKKGIVYSKPNAERTKESFDQRENLYDSYMQRLCIQFYNIFTYSHGRKFTHSHIVT